jgi:hypothetical protein
MQGQQYMILKARQGVDLEKRFYAVKLHLSVSPIIPISLALSINLL